MMYSSTVTHGIHGSAASLICTIKDMMMATQIMVAEVTWRSLDMIRTLSAITIHKTTEKQTNFLFYFLNKSANYFSNLVLPAKEMSDLTKPPTEPKKTAHLHKEHRTKF